MCSLTNDSHRAESVGQNVKENSLHDLTPASTMAVSVTSVVRMTMTSIMRVAVSRSAVLENEDAHQVDEEAEDGDD